MSDRSKKLADRLNSFNEEVISFVESCTETDLRKIGTEEWPVGVTGRHIGANHYSAMSGAKMILKGEKFPEMTMEQVTENANRHAREHAECSKSEVLDILRDHGRKIVEFAGGLEDSELDKTGYLPALGSNITVEQFLETVVLQAASEHFQSMKTATGK
ncbi:MAG: hypothetical protein ABSG35_09765 [Syntrophobacteraceae bacterium]|jgi:hypothetical protein